MRNETTRFEVEQLERRRLLSGDPTVSIDDEPRIGITGVVGAYEGDSGTTPLTFTVDLSAAYDQPVMVNFATQDYTAVAGEDYLANSGMLTFAPGETTKTITVTVMGDTTAEADEGLFVIFSGVSANASMRNGESASYGSIQDDDGYYGGGPDSDPWSYWPGYEWY